MSDMSNADGVANCAVIVSKLQQQLNVIDISVITLGRNLDKTKILVFCNGGPLRN